MSFGDNNFVDPLEGPGFDFVDTSDQPVPPASLPGGVETADQTYRTSPGSANLTDWDKIVKALTSPAGIAGLGGAALGYLDRPQPTGGGTTMAYPGAAPMERRIVQGPYGPLAEYTGPGGGPLVMPSPAPVAPAPTAPGVSGSLQSKIDQYKTLQGYGLSPEAIRKFAESIYGPQTDKDWTELVRLVGSTGGISGAKPPAAPSPAPAPSPSPAPAPAPATTPATTGTTQKPTSAASEELTTYMTRIADYLPSFNPDELAAIYNHFKSKGLSNDIIRSAVEKVVGGQSDQNWEYLRNLSNTMPADLLATAPNLGVNTIKSAVAKWKNPTGKAQGGVIRSYAQGGEAQAYAGGRPLTMEDGGFVFTKAATDELGPRGIAALGGKMISAPGNGTNDKGITSIMGRNGATPARVSDGEAYVPQRFVQAQGGPQRMYALMNSLERKA